MSDDDAELVALIDNELDEGRRTALLARLADDGSRQRYGELWQTSAPLAASFDVLLEQAPLARLRTALAAGAAKWAASTFGLFDGREDWRTAMAEYTHLYTNQTFSSVEAGRRATGGRTERGRRGGAREPCAENVALPGLRFTWAFMLS